MLRWRSPTGYDASFGRTGKSLPTDSAKPVGATVTSQPLILKDEQSGLQTRTATTESVSLRADEKLTAFLEEPCAVVFNRALKVTALDERAALA